MKKRRNIMMQNFDNYESVRFKNWIKKRIINEVDILNTPYKNILLWSEAFHELGDELINTWCIARPCHHEIVPFRRSLGK